MTTEIFDISFDGQGVGKFNNKIVFVPETAIGDVVKFEIVKEKKNLIFGKIVSFVEKSPIRRDVDCSFFTKCGGCDFLHLKEIYEQSIKENIISNILKKHFDMSHIQFEEAKYDYDFYKYRNKVVFQCSVENNMLHFGFFEKGSNNLIKISCCKLFDESFIKIANALTLHLSKELDSKYLKSVKHIVLKKNSSNDILLGIVLKEKNEKVLEVLKKINFESVKTLVVNINSHKNSRNFGEENIIIYGKGYIKESLFNYDFDISLLSFFQVNKEQTIKLYEHIFDFLRNEKVSTVIDGYCGVGTIAFSLSDHFEKVIGVEIEKQSFESACEALQKNNVNNVEFIHGKFEDKIDKILDENTNASLVLDPPRRGCDKNVINSIIKNNIDTIIYVSCDLSGFVKDMKILQDYYIIKQYSVINMFPRTKDIETVIALKRK